MQQRVSPREKYFLSNMCSGCGQNGEQLDMAERVTEVSAALVQLEVITTLQFELIVNLFSSGTPHILTYLQQCVLVF